MKKFIKVIQIIIALIFALYISIIAFFYSIPSKIFELWEDLKWWTFLLFIGLTVYSVYCLISLLIADYISEISKKTNKKISKGLVVLILFFVAGIFNFNHDDNIILFLIFIPINFVFYFSLVVKLDKVTDFSYKKGWYDGYKDRLTRYYGKSYEEGLKDGINFKEENEKR